MSVIALCPVERHRPLLLLTDLAEHVVDLECRVDHTVRTTLPLVEVTRPAEVVEWVTVHEVTRHYGGPEEGGWWYDAGTVVMARAVLPGQTWEQVCDGLEQQFDIHTNHRSSVRPRGRDYRLEIGKEPGTCYPETRPTYC